MTEKPLSAQERKIFDFLCAAQRPLSAYDLLAGLREQGVRSPPTVYRALETLTTRGFVHRLESLSAFVPCRCGPRGCQGVHSASFAICTHCGAVSEIDDAALRRAVHEAGHGFLAKVDGEVLEIKGLCRVCADTDEGKACSCLH